MKKQFFLFFASLFAINSNAQIVYEKGYIINSAGERIDCLIKNVDWENNPTKVTYKLSENSDKKFAKLQDTKEFGIDNISKYVKSQVKIDRSSNELDNLSKKREPEFNEEVLFLKVLVEGEANLYGYVKGKLKRYFYNIEDAPIEQLVYKLHEKISDKITYNTSNKVRYNKDYKKQIWKNLKCPTTTFAEVEDIDYRKKELVDYFVKYNECNNAVFINFEAKQKKDRFNLNIRPGLNFSTLSIENSVSASRNVDFEGQLAFRVGLEAEFIMPFNKNKWAVIIEPTYQSFKAEQEARLRIAVANYQSIEVPFGIRHYFFLNDKSKIFIDAAYILDLKFNSSIEFNPGSDLRINTRNNIGFGIGYKYNKFSIQFKRQLGREILNFYASWFSDYSTSSLIFGYSIF